MSKSNKYFACSHTACSHPHEIPQFLIGSQCQYVKEVSIPTGNYLFQMQNGPEADMAFLIADIDEISEGAVLTLAETMYKAFSKSASPLTDRQSIDEIGKYYKLQLEGQDTYEFFFVVDNSKAIAVFLSTSYDIWQPGSQTLGGGMDKR